MLNKKMQLQDYPMEDNFYQELSEEELKRLLANVASKKSRSKSMSKMDDVKRCLEIEGLIKKQLTTNDVQPTSLTEENIEAVDNYDDITRMIKNIQSQKCLAKAMGRQEKYDKMIAMEEIASAKRDTLEPNKALQLQVKIDELNELGLEEEVLAKILEVIKK